MSYAQCEFDATDEAGNLLSNVSVEVRRQPGLTLEPLYSDREGASNLANPFTATDGKVKFFAAGGAFRVVLTAGSYTRTRDYVALGRAAETDLLLTSPKGAWSSGSTYSKGDLVSVAVGTLTRLFASIQNSNTNHTPDSSTPGDTSWWMYVGTVAGTASAPGITLTYDSTTSAADPGNGKFRLNNATHSSATALYADNVEALAGASITSLLDSWDDSTSTLKGRLKIAKASDPTVFRIYTVTGSVVDSSGYRTITISYVTGAGSLSNSDQCVFTFLATGDKGNIGGSTGSTDNALLRADGTGGATAQASAVIVDDSGNITSFGGRIAFPATQNASTNANTLDDYEEGTFTPVLEGTTTAGVGTYVAQIGNYVKIGKSVTFMFECVWTGHTGTGNMQFNGLPFTNGSAQSVCGIEVGNLTYAAQLFALIAASNTIVTPYTAASGGANTAVPMDTAATFRASGVYIAAG